MQSGYAFSINSKDDPEILEYLEKWGEINDATFTKNQKITTFVVVGIFALILGFAVYKKYNK